MSAYHAQRQARRLGFLAVFLMGGLVGCSDSAPTSSTVSTQDPKAGGRRKAMLEYEKNKPAGGSTKGASSP